MIDNSPSELVLQNSRNKYGKFGFFFLNSVAFILCIFFGFVMVFLLKCHHVPYLFTDEFWNSKRHGRRPYFSGKSSGKMVVFKKKSCHDGEKMVALVVQTMNCRIPATADVNMLRTVHRSAIHRNNLMEACAVIWDLPQFLT